MAMMSVVTSSFTPSNLLAHTRNARLESSFLPLNFQTPVAALVAGDRRRRRREPLMIRNAITSVLGIILGGGAGTRLYPLTKKRAKPAVPLGANYRLIDIPVSNCLNISVQKIYVLTQFNSASLNRHLSCAYGSSMGGYKDEGFVEVLAAQQSPENPNWFQIAPLFSLPPSLLHSLSRWGASMETLQTKGVCFSFPEIKRSKTSHFVEYKKQYKHRNPKLTTFCACGEFSSQPFTDPQNYKDALQNVDLPEIQPKKKKKPFPVPIKKMIQESRKDKMLARKGIEKTLIAPKNGILVPELVPVAHSVLENWKILIKGITQLLTVVSVYGCSNCSEIHVGPAGHEIQDCRGTGSERRNSFHTWVRGSANDVLTPVEAYHVFDPFGKRVKHETRFAYDRIPAVVELCIQAGVDLPEYPSRRRTEPIRMMGKRVIYRGGFVEEPKAHRAEDRTSLLYELDTYAAQLAQNPPSPPTDIRQLAEQTLRAYGTVRGGVRKLMRLYSVKACGYCSEINVGPWGHNVKLCGAFKHQWRDGKHGWQDSTLDEVVPPNYVWHVKDPNGPPLKTGLKRYYGKAPAVVELCVQAGAEIPSPYKPMMRLDIIVPDSDEARFVF